MRRLDPTCDFVIEATRYEREFSWDGHSLVVRPGLYGVMTDLHDISHFVVAPAERRFLPEFGIGGDPNRWNSRPKVVVEDSVAQYEEELACYLQLGLGLALGFDHFYVKREGESLNTEMPDDTRIYMVQQYTPDGLSPDMWRRVYDAVRSL
jgi:elongation factor P hydroxylase